MVCAAASQPVARPETPHSDLAIFLVEAKYRELGCDRWNSRSVQLLCAKFGDTPKLMSARLRISFPDFERRMKTDGWTKQDRLILSLLELEIDFARGGKSVNSDGGETP